MIIAEVFLIMKSRWFLFISKSLHISIERISRTTEYTKTTNRQINKFNKRKLRAQCLKKLMVLLIMINTSHEYNTNNDKYYQC